MQLIWKVTDQIQLSAFINKYTLITLKNPINIIDIKFPQCPIFAVFCGNLCTMKLKICKLFFRFVHLLTFILNIIVHSFVFQ